MKKLLLVLGVLVMGASLVRAEPLTVEEAVEQALRRNVDYQASLLAVDRARNSLSSWVNWKGIAVSATQKQSSGSGGTATPGAQASSTTSVALNLPLLDQLGASVSLDQDKNAQISVNLNPLVHSDTAAQARINWEKTLLTAAQARRSLETAVRKAYWNQVAAAAQVGVQTKKTALKETAYQDAKARYAKGSVTLAEVRSALQDWMQARTGQTAAERSLVKARSDLAEKLQGEIDVIPLDSAALEAAVKALGDAGSSSPGLSSAVKLQALDADAAQAKADAVWWFDPGLTVSGSAAVPAQGNLTWSGSVSVTLALGDWQAGEKSVADRSADLARQTLEAQKAQARSNEVQALLIVRSATDTVETRTLALAQAKELQTETRLLLKEGEATALEAEDADLGVISAEIDVFSAWADLYGAKLDLAALRS